MNHLTKLLARNTLAKHDGRALWRYNLDAQFFYLLQNHLRNAHSLTAIDAKDCALYYAAWWKCAYDGGYPSKQEIFNTIANKQAFGESDFYRHAIHGAKLLGVRWIRNANTHYFRTLLLQGGLPVRHIGKNKGAYTRFLLRILEVNPTAIDDFAFDFSITSILPPSSRNDEIYACCLQIVKAVNNEDADYLSLLEKDDVMGEISAELKSKKRSLTQVPHKRRLRSFWVLEPAKASIWLYLGFPEMDAETFRDKLLINDDREEEPSYEYKLFYEERVVCKFIRNSVNRYTVVWVSSARLRWDGTDQRPDLYLIAQDGRRHCCTHLLGSLPSLQRPTLWTRYSEGQWLLQKGTHTAEDNAMVLYPEAFRPQDGLEAGLVEVANEILYGREFKGQFNLLRDGAVLTYKTGCPSFDWYVPDEGPLWLQKANMPVVRSKPKLVAYDKNGELLPNATKRWRSKGEQCWKAWNEPMPKGLIEFCIEVNGVQEEDCFFNIGALQLEVRNSTLLEAELYINNNDFRLQLNASTSSLVSVAILSDKEVRLTCTDATKQPKSIGASLRLVGQSKGIQFEMAPPFSGVELIGNDECVIAEDHKLLLDHLYGYRLLCDRKPLFVRLYNTKCKDIVLSQSLSEVLLPLTRFSDKIEQLFSLCDPLDGRAEVQIEVWRDDNKSVHPVRSYSIQRYAQQLECSVDDQGQALVKAGNIDVELLYAVPLECENANISLAGLVPTEEGYRFLDEPQASKYIVFGEGGKRGSIKPAFLNLVPPGSPTPPDDRMGRLELYRLSLLEGGPESDCWKQLLAYYQICIDNHLSFATFELLRSCSFSSLLAARLFVFLVSYGTSEQFVTAECPQLEADLGFCFHWVAKQHWQDAMEWAGCEFGSRDFTLFWEAISGIYSAQHPIAHFSQIRRFAMQDQWPVVDTSVSPTQKFNNIRSSLGEKVLCGIPRQCPVVPEAYEKLLPVACADNLALLVKGPLAVALSIAGKKDCLWCAEGEHIRRNVRYSQQLHPDWYGYAVCHFLSKS